jgi:hypothetical protein
MSEERELRELHEEIKEQERDARRLRERLIEWLVRIDFIDTPEEIIRNAERLKKYIETGK